jgi:hypothetical protein
MLILYNKVKRTGLIPTFMRFANIAAIYKGTKVKCSVLIQKEEYF